MMAKLLEARNMTTMGAYTSGFHFAAACALCASFESAGEAGGCLTCVSSAKRQTPSSPTAERAAVTKKVALKPRGESSAAKAGPRKKATPWQAPSLPVYLGR